MLNDNTNVTNVCKDAKINDQKKVNNCCIIVQLYMLRVSCVMYTKAWMGAK